MRIGGYGTGPGGRGAGDRATQFRSQRRVGERIRGRVLRRDPSGLFWVQVGEQELLANLEAEAEPGAQFLFVVRSLFPEIVLQLVQDQGGAPDLPRSILDLRTARQSFEHKAASLLDELRLLAPDPALRRGAFLNALAETPGLAQAFALVLAQLRGLNAHLAQAAAGHHALYLPWLLPGLRGQETLVTAQPSGLTEAVTSASIHGLGAVELRLTVKAERCGLKLAMERPELLGEMKTQLDVLLSQALGAQAEYLGVAKLSFAGGALGALLAGAPQGPQGRLNARI